MTSLIADRRRGSSASIESEKFPPIRKEIFTSSPAQARAREGGLFSAEAKRLRRGQRDPLHGRGVGGDVDEEASRQFFEIRKTIFDKTRFEGSNRPHGTQRRGHEQEVKRFPPIRLS